MRSDGFIDSVRVLFRILRVLALPTAAGQRRLA